jgi:hypothetical protein
LPHLTLVEASSPPGMFGPGRPRDLCFKSSPDKEPHRRLRSWQIRPRFHVAAVAAIVAKIVPAKNASNSRIFQVTSTSIGRPLGVARGRGGLYCGPLSRPWPVLRSTASGIRPTRANKRFRTPSHVCKGADTPDQLDFPMVLYRMWNVAKTRSSAELKLPSDWAR